MVGPEVHIDLLARFFDKMTMKIFPFGVLQGPRIIIILITGGSYTIIPVARWRFDQ